MKKLLFLLTLVIIFSCEKKDSCWECSQQELNGPHRHTIEYCGNFAGMKAVERQKNSLYTPYRCSLKP